MAVAADFHIHSNFSGDSDTPMESMILEGIRLGLQTMCFTEHLDLDYPYEEIDFSLDLSTYYQTLLSMRQKYCNKIEILFGVELGIQPHLSSTLQDIVAAYPFDFVIGSTHLIDHLDPYYPQYFQNYSDQEGFRRYFEEVLENLKTFSDFDSLGHLDYIVRYSPNKTKHYCWKDYQDLMDQILLFLIQSDISLEVNTAGLKYELGQTNPAPDILKRYRELGGTNITIGSDAHCPQHLAYQFSVLSDLLRQCGFSYYTIYRNRTPYQIPLISMT